MQEFIKMPVTIQAIQMPGYGEDPSPELMELVEAQGWEGEGESLLIPTPEGTMTAEPNDWIIRGIKGEYYPCKPDIFAATYRSAKLKTEGMSFGEALELLKAGQCVARKGWNGKGMWLSLSGAPKTCRSVPADGFWSKNNAEFARRNGGHAGVLPCITMKTASDEILMGWLASQTDMLADDWCLVEEPA